MIDIREGDFSRARAVAVLGWAAALACTGLTGGALAAGEEIDCPQRIRLAQSVQTSPDGWAASGDEAWRQVVNVRFSEGEPAQQLFLRPNETKGGKVQEVRVWHFTPSGAGYWVSCAYADTGVLVSRKLPESVRSCKVESLKKGDNSVSIRLDCRSDEQ